MHISNVSTFLTGMPLIPCSSICYGGIRASVMRGRRYYYRGITDTAVTHSRYWHYLLEILEQPIGDFRATDGNNSYHLWQAFYSNAIINTTEYEGSFFAL